ncbi:MFS transporter [Nocardioides marmotae]|uniref:MFS transporter n=1 Tax=Nocardioides marmotae TaxID=2663857 RepID=UPI0012B62FDB|nr:MFS transporter [Nocardioides marmotae]MBC9732350.1 MFS transporter [Nocardioides marmotae]MTB83471.1 MFS transporter [Nocardioides marmotae]
MTHAVSDERSLMPRPIYVLALVAFIVALGFGIVGPAIPLLAEQFGVGKSIAASAISAFALCRLASAFANGKLVETFGEQTVLAVGLGSQAVTTILAGLAPNFALVVVFRAIGGFGSAAFTVAAMSLLLRLAPPTHRGRAASIYQGGFLLGAIIGPGIGGLLTEVTPRLPFFVYGVFLAIAGVVGMWLLRPGPRGDEPAPDRSVLAEHSDEVPVVVARGSSAPEDSAEEPEPTLRQALRSRPYVACLVAQFGIGWMLYGVRNSLMPIYVVEDLDHSAAWAGMAFLIGSAAQGLMLLRVGSIVDSRGRKPVMVLGSAIVTVAVAALAFPPNTTVFLLAMIAFGGGGALLASAPAAVLGDISRGSGGRVVAVFQMAADVGAVIGPLAAGLLTDIWSYQVAFAAGSLVLLLSLALSITMPETMPGAQEDDSPDATTHQTSGKTTADDSVPGAARRRAGPGTNPA